MRLLVFIIISLISFNNLIAQDLEWVKDIGGNNFVTINAIDSDVNGNVYTIGTFEGPIDFDPSGASFVLSPKLNGYKDIFIQKLDRNGQFVWAKNIGETNSNFCSDMAVSNDGSFYISGHFRDSLDFDPSSNTNRIYSQGQDEGYIAKYDSTGSLLWAKGLHSSENSRVFRLELDNSNNLIATGSFDRNFSFGAFNSADSVGLGSRNDIFVCKIDQNGNWIWGKGLGGVSYISSSSVAVDGNNSVYLSGSFQGTADFDPSGSVFQLTAKGNYDVFILKFDANGVFSWVKTLESSASSFSAETKINNSGVFVSGYFADTLDMDPGPSNYPLHSTGNFDAFIVRLDLQGNFVWGKSIYGVNGSYGNRLSFNNANEVLVEGEFFGTCDFDPDSSSVVNITSNGNTDIYILKLADNGNFNSVITIGGPGYDYLKDGDETSKSEFLYTGSFTSNIIDFDPQSGTTNVITNGQFNYYTLKLSDSSGSVGIVQNSNWLDTKFSAYPNPANEFIQIENPHKEEVNMLILDANGQLVLKEMQLNPGKNQIPIDLPKGMYFIQLQSNLGSEVIKLIKD